MTAWSKRRLLKVSSVSRRREAGVREVPSAAKLMKPLSELNRRVRVGLYWVLFAGGAWSFGIGKGVGRNSFRVLWRAAVGADWQGTVEAAVDERKRPYGWGPSGLYRVWGRRG